MKYIKRTGKKASKRPGASYKAVGKKPPLGEGGRFKALTGALKKKGATNPAALAAYIGRKKLGKAKMSALAAKGRRK